MSTLAEHILVWFITTGRRQTQTAEGIAAEAISRAKEIEQAFAADFRDLMPANVSEQVVRLAWPIFAHLVTSADKRVPAYYATEALELAGAFVRMQLR